MRTLLLSALAATALGALAFAALPASAQDVENGYGAPPPTDDSAGAPPAYADAYANTPECNPANYGPGQPMPLACASQAYCDQYGCPDDFYDMPIWYGPVFYENVWFAGPVYYRMSNGRRQYWIHGAWHFDNWRGPRPSWWNAGHYHVGPALGRVTNRNQSASAAGTSVRVWRGTAASTYQNDGNGRYYGHEVATSVNRPNITPRPIGSVAVKTQAVSQQRVPQPRYNAIHASRIVAGHNVGVVARTGAHGRSR